jgi:Aminotransferase class I and II
MAIQSFVMEDLFEEDLGALRARSLDRHFREIGSAQGPEIEIGGRRLINFCSNDYLGLANDPRLRKAATAAIDEFGVGAGAPRLISETQSPHLVLERAPVKWKGTEAALCFASGYAAAIRMAALPMRTLVRQKSLQDRFQFFDRSFGPKRAISDQRGVQCEMFRPIRFGRDLWDYIHNYFPRRFCVCH